MLIAKRIRTRIEEGGRSAPLPLVSGLHYLQYRISRMSAAHEDRDKGALSIELALLVIVLIAAAGLVVGVITTVVTTETGKITAP
ncbi:hypothetical protein EDD99_0717 [Streptomyces sp. 846.5]|nr:hypothetical protein [Streptomyces sp. 846.5]TDU02326.1 hypothetical protein EDD99_0717 [Streptomyces sp. 846.5]